ncbi:MAG TPA: N-acetyl-gamma-glutamyl-phosphate reductase, partial [Patescibacteria group bacterium]|nr:N-acetyl-gamma-glutamyl-phosphate reductase [Patescibacteria group bacterium]
MHTRIQASVIGATGYAGAALCSLLERHGGVELTGRYASGRVDAASVTAPAGARLDVERLDIEAMLASRPGCVFLATPNEVSADLAPRLIASGIRVIDLSGAFRLKQAEAYPRWYGFDHPAPALLEESVYGLTEWCDGSLDSARLVANPGCYATSALMA